MTSAIVTQTVPDEHPGWMRDATFDRMFILGTALVATLSGLVVAVRPGWWTWVLGADLWLLGYHHVIATSTRLVFDAESREQHRFLIFGLAPIVLVATAAVYVGLGVWAVTSVYFYWQWWHYTRQSYGIERIYARKAAGGGRPIDSLTRFMIYGVPLWGLLHRSAQGSETFLGTDIWWVPVPAFVANAFGVVALAATALWLMRLFTSSVSRAHSLYVVSHLAVFSIGYILIPAVTLGWLVINIWHNFQYILVVWVYNVGRFREGPDPKARLLSYLSQPRRIATYMATMLAISTLAYLIIGGVAEVFSSTAFELGVVIYMAINFHHYVVDSVIWKMRKPSNQSAMGVTTA